MEQIPQKEFDELKSKCSKTTQYLLLIEYLLIWYSIVILLGCCMIAAYVQMLTIWRIVLIMFGMINVCICFWVGIIIETKVGYYKCRHCNHKYIPTYKQIIWSMHAGRTRYLKCPNCQKSGWSKKVISND